MQSAIPQENARSVSAGAASITAMANGTTMASEPAIRSATVAPVLITSVTLAAAGGRATSTTVAAAAFAVVQYDEPPQPGQCRQHKQQQVARDLPIVVLGNAVGEEVCVKIKVGVFQA